MNNELNDQQISAIIQLFLKADPIPQHYNFVVTMKHNSDGNTVKINRTATSAIEAEKSAAALLRDYQIISTTQE